MKRWKSVSTVLSICFYIDNKILQHSTKVGGSTEITDGPDFVGRDCTTDKFQADTL